MEMENHFQLISGNGDFNSPRLEEFAGAIGLHGVGSSNRVVSIMGPQSSGKSTLLNHLFGTSFEELDAEKDWKQTTSGIWMAGCANIEPMTIVMDVEGTDGRERGEDIKFEKQSALFALATSHIVLVNTPYQNIGQENGACRPLLRTMFQVMVHIAKQGKTTLLFSLRDRTKTPLHKLKQIVQRNTQDIWTSTKKSKVYEGKLLNDFFNIEVVALPHYETEEFKQEVDFLRQKIYDLIAAGGRVGDQRQLETSSAFVDYFEKTWNCIKEIKDLDLPSKSIMVSTVLCDKLVEEKYAQFVKDEAWINLERQAESELVPGFGKALSSLIRECLSRYDEEANYYDDKVNSYKREKLLEKILQLVLPSYEDTLGHLRSKILKDFIVAFGNALRSTEKRKFADASRDCTKLSLSEFDTGCADAAVDRFPCNSSGGCIEMNYDLFQKKKSAERKILNGEIEAHVASVRAGKLDKLMEKHKKQLKKKLERPVAASLGAGDDKTWPAIRKLLRHERKRATSDFSSDLQEFDIDQERKERMLADLKEHAANVVESKSKDEARDASVLMHMKHRFANVFNNALSAEGNAMFWSSKLIEVATKNANKASLKLLALKAAIRLEYKSDDIATILLQALIESPQFSVSDPLASSYWTGVPAGKTLLTPAKCKSLWKKFEVETQTIVHYAYNQQSLASIRFGSVAAVPMLLSMLRGLLVTSGASMASPEMVVATVAAMGLAIPPFLVSAKDCLHTVNREFPGLNSSSNASTGVQVEELSDSDDSSEEGETSDGLEDT